MVNSRRMVSHRKITNCKFQITNSSILKNVVDYPLPCRSKLVILAKIMTGLCANPDN